MFQVPDRAVLLEGLPEGAFQGAQEDLCERCADLCVESGSEA